jgi:hypothetical protein
LKLVVWIPRNQGEDIGSLPVDMSSYSQEELGDLQVECLKIVASVLGSRTFQTSVGRSFAAGDVDILTNDSFAPIVENLLLLASQSQRGISSLLRLI